MNVKKIMMIIGLVVLVFGLAIFIALSGERSPDEERPELGEDVIYIRESRFMTQVTNIHSNMRRYTGRTVALEGFIIGRPYQDRTIYMAGRNNPGCCGDDGFSGFILIYDRRNTSRR